MDDYEQASGLLFIVTKSITIFTKNKHDINILLTYLKLTYTSKHF